MAPDERWVVWLGRIDDPVDEFLVAESSSVGSDEFGSVYLYWTTSDLIDGFLLAGSYSVGSASIPVLYD